jgi:hypothetical protein
VICRGSRHDIRILDLATHDPLLVGCVGHLNPGADGFGENLARFSKNRLFQGIRAGGASIALDEVWDLFGADRVMYGSNWPVSENLAPCPVVFNIVKQYVTARGAADSVKYFSKNSKACYRWMDRT